MLDLALKMVDSSVPKLDEQKDLRLVLRMADSLAQHLVV